MPLGVSIIPALRVLRLILRFLSIDSLFYKVAYDPDGAQWPNI